MFGLVRRNPALPLRQLGAALGGPGIPPHRDHFSYTGYARFALANLFEVLGFQPDDRVLLPAYICDAVLVAFDRQRLVPSYYGITDGFDVDYSTIQNPERAKAIITVNYFGLGQDFERVGRFAREHGLMWINDNGHGFAARDGSRSVEELGDVSVSAFRKVIPAVNGARVRINAPELSPLKARLDELNASAASGGSVGRFLASTAVQHLRFRAGGLPDYTDIREFSESGVMAERLHPISANILHLIDESDVQQRRLALYRAIDRLLIDSAPPWIERIAGGDRPGASPMVYPLVIREPAHWKRFLGLARSARIDAHTWPALPGSVIDEDLFGAASLWRRLVFLPLHQQLDRAAYIRRLAQLIRAFS